MSIHSAAKASPSCSSRSRRRPRTWSIAYANCSQARSGSGVDRSVEAEEPCRVVDQHPVARLAVGYIPFEQVQGLELVVDAVPCVRVLTRPDEAMDMWPVSAPHAAIRRRLVEHP